jgi:hypothetical protein
MKVFVFLVGILLICFSCKKTSTNTTIVKNEATAAKSITIKGLNFVAVPDPFSQDPMPAVKNVNANWIAVIPYGYTMPNEARVHYNGKKWQWYGEKPEGVKATIKAAHEAGIKVLLKPQVYCPYSWTGGLDFDSDEKWQAWEKDYTKYLLQFVTIAVEYKVEMICIGTEFKISVQKRPDFWKKLISEIRETYKGQLTYAANWDEFELVTFWDDLDYIGINAYFPLSNEKTPSLPILQKAWEKPLIALEKFYNQHQKPIIFTEYGYLSVDSCAYQGWELEKKVTEMSINEQAQANAIEAILITFSQKKWWKGGFLWKWFPNMQGHEGYPERDYSPQGKLAAKTLAKYYGH